MRNIIIICGDYGLFVSKNLFSRMNINGILVNAGSRKVLKIDMKAFVMLLPILKI